MKKIIAITVAAIALLGASYGYYLYTKKAKDFTNAKVDIYITAGDIYQDFISDETKANRVYVIADKVIQVTGVVKSYNINTDSTQTIILTDTKSPEALINITLESKIPINANLVSSGLQIKVNGQCTGILDDFIEKKVQFIRGGVVL